MDLRSITLFRMAEKQMGYMEQRHTVIASNIANANTPDFMPSDLKPLSFKKELQKAGVELSQTRPMHLRQDAAIHTVQAQTSPLHQPSTIRVPGPNREEPTRRPYETSIDKNGVIQEEQHLKLANTRHMHEVAATLYKKYNSMVTMSLGMSN